jgi:hypothetical protein
VVDPTGHESIVFFDMVGHTVIGRVGPDVHLSAGEPVGLTLSRARLHFFASGTGLRLNADRETAAKAAVRSRFMKA